MRYKPVAEYVPGKTLVIADTLSRSPQTYTKETTDTHSDVACHVAAVMEGIPASPTKMDSLRKATSTDGELQTVIKFIVALNKGDMKDLDPWRFPTMGTLRDETFHLKKKKTIER